MGAYVANLQVASYCCQVYPTPIVFALDVANMRCMCELLACDLCFLYFLLDEVCLCRIWQC